MEEPIHLSQLNFSNETAPGFARLGDDYIFLPVRPGEDAAATLEAPVRFYGMTLFRCRSGYGTLEINLERYDITTDMLLVLPPGSLVRTCEIQNLEGDVLFISVPFLHNVNFDLNVLSQTLVYKEKPSPMLSLDREECGLVDKFMQLLAANATDNAGSQPIAVNIARSLVSGLFYQIMLIAGKRTLTDGVSTESGTTMSARRLSYVSKFGRLVQQYYRRERSVAFYASKLFISPKYLSLLVKEATGRSAAALIDEFVILEAKNMLRFSRRNIQQITYDLNFPNQSAFGKYFKHLTGMSPSQYQKS